MPMTTQDQNLAIVTGIGALVIGGAVLIGASIDTMEQPTQIEAAMQSTGPTRIAHAGSGSAAVETRIEDMPPTGQSEIDSAPVAPGDSVTVSAQLPDEWSWRGDLVLTGDAFGKFAVGDAHVETREDGHRWIVVTATNAGDTPARFDALFDYIPAPQVAIDAGTD